MLKTIAVPFSLFYIIITVSQLKSTSVHTINANIATSSRVMIPDACNTSLPDPSDPSDSAHPWLSASLVMAANWIEKYFI